ncbi:MAG: RNA polymerase sigma factor [Bacteroidia bacterium]
MATSDFRSKVTKEADPLRHFAYRLTQDDEDAADLVQDTMLKAFTNEEKFAEGTNLKGWLYTMMKNIFINKYRRAMKSKIFNDQTDDQYFLNSAASDRENLGESNLVMKDINDAIGRLSENLRTPFLLSFQGFKYEEIASGLRIPLGTVKVRIHNARKELMKMLKDYSV